MTRLADAIQRTATRTVQQQSAGWLLATVTTVRTDGTLDVTTATGPVERVRRVRSYAAPVVGDTVRVDKSPDGNWLVTGALAAENHGWQPLVLASGFSWNGGPTDGFPQVRLTDDGLLQLSGLVKGVAPAGATTQFATLPAGVSTALWIRGVAMTSVIGTYAGVGVSPAGAVNVYPGSAHGASTWFQLDGILGRSR